MIGAVSTWQWSASRTPGAAVALCRAVGVSDWTSAAKALVRHTRIRSSVDPTTADQGTCHAPEPTAYVSRCYHFAASAGQPRQLLSTPCRPAWISLVIERHIAGKSAFVPLALEFGLLISRVQWVKLGLLAFSSALHSFLSATSAI